MMSLQVKAMAEAATHNKTMEELKQKEIAAALTENEHKKKIADMKEKEMDLAHRLSLVDAYEKVKGKLSDSIIRKRFPELVEFLESEDDE